MKGIREYPNIYNHIPGFEFTSMRNRLEELPELFQSPFLTNDYRIIIPYTHIANHQLDAQKIPFQPYSIFFTGKNKVHLFDPNSHYDGVAIGFTESFLCRNEEDLTLLTQTPLFNSHNWEMISPLNIKDYLAILRDIEHELLLPDKEPQIIRNLLHNFILLATREYSKHQHIRLVRGADAQITQRYRLLIAHNFKTIRTVAAYAEILNVTEKRLNQATHHVLKKTAKAVFDELLMIEAKRLVTFSNLSVKEIGFELGFSQSTHFIKYFMKHTGVAPGAFRSTAN